MNSNSMNLEVFLASKTWNSERYSISFSCDFPLWDNQHISTCMAYVLLHLKLLRDCLVWSKCLRVLIEPRPSWRLGKGFPAGLHPLPSFSLLYLWYMILLRYPLWFTHTLYPDKAGTPCVSLLKSWDSRAVSPYRLEGCILCNHFTCVTATIVASRLLLYYCTRMSSLLSYCYYTMPWTKAICGEKGIF